MAAMVQTIPEAGVQARVTEEAKAAFDYTCRYYLNISGEEFLRRLDAGEYKNPTQTEVRRVLSMLPFAR